MIEILQAPRKECHLMITLRPNPEKNNERKDITTEEAEEMGKRWGKKRKRISQKTLEVIIDELTGLGQLERHIEPLLHKTRGQVYAKNTPMRSEEKIVEKRVIGMGKCKRDYAV